MFHDLNIWLCCILNINVFVCVCSVCGCVYVHVCVHYFALQDKGYVNYVWFIYTQICIHECGYVNYISNTHTSMCNKLQNNQRHYLLSFSFIQQVSKSHTLKNKSSKRTTTKQNKHPLPYPTSPPPKQKTQDSTLNQHKFLYYQFHIFNPPAFTRSRYARPHLLCLPPSLQAENTNARGLSTS